MFNRKTQKCGSKNWRQILALVLLLGCCAFFLFCLTGLSLAANIKVVPSSSRVSPGENFYIDIVVEDIPQEGLDALQFRLNVDVPGFVVKGVSDISQPDLNAVSVATPLIIGPPTSTRSGIGQFFLDAAGPHGILVMDNENLSNGSGLYTFAQTNGSTPQGGSGTVARFQLAIGKNVATEKINITLSEVLLLNSGTAYALASNTGTAIELGCTAIVPDLINLSQSEAQAALQAAGLLTGNIYEINNLNGIYDLNKVLQQSIAAGSTALCETHIDLAINTAPSEVGDAAAVDKTGDESGAVILSWTPSLPTDTAGYRIYLITGTQTLLKEVRDPALTGLEVSGLTNGQVSSLKITAVDNFGNESQGVVISATALDDVYPEIEITGVEEGAYYRESVLPAVNVTEANPGPLEITLNGSPYDLLPISNNGNYTLRVVAKDASGNSTSKEVHFTIDTIAPELTVSTLSDGSWTNNDLLNVSGMLTDNIGLRQLVVNGDIVAVDTDGSFSWPVELVDGENTIEIRAVDLAGNEATDTRTVYLDRNAPAIVIITPVDNLKTRFSPIELTGTVDEQSTVSVKINGSEAVPALMEGNNFSLAIEPAYDVNTIEVTATDRANNTSTAKRTVIFDDRTPSLAIIYPAQDVRTNLADMTLKGETADLTAVSITLTMDGAIYTPDIIDGRFEQTVSFTEEKNYQIYAAAVDEAGNETLVQRNIVYDITAPTVAIDPVAGPANIDSQTLTGVVEEGALVTVSCPDATVGAVAYPTSSSWAVDISGMQEGINTITVSATDEAGNTSPEVSADIMADMTPPQTTITAGAPNHVSQDGSMYVAGSTQFSLSATDALSGVATTEYRIDGGTWMPYAPFAISAEGTHLIEYRSSDNAGNTEPAGTLSVIVDNTTPVTAVSVGEPKHSGPTLFVRGDTPFMLSASDLLSGVAHTELRTNSGQWHSYSGPFTVNSEGIVADGAVLIEYRSKDNVGNLEASQSLSVTIDNTGPSVDAGPDIFVYADEDGMKTVNIDAAVSDPEGFDPSPAILWTENNAVISDQEDLSYKFNIGTHILTIKAVDHLGNSSTDEVKVKVLGRQAELTYTGDTEVDWSDTASLVVHVGDVTGGQNSVPLAGYGKVVFRILNNGVEQYSYDAGITDSEGNAMVQHLFFGPDLSSDYTIAVDFYDPAGIYQASSLEVPFIVRPEKGTQDYTGDQVVTVNDSGIQLQTTLYQEEDETNGSLIDFNNDANQVFAQFDIYKFNETPGQAAPYFQSVPVRVTNSEQHSGVGVAGIFVPLKTLGTVEENYTVITRLLENGYVSAYNDEATVTVYDPDGRFFTGGGFIIDPVTGLHNNFSFTFKYNKRGKPQGNMVYIVRNEADGTKTQIKSNALKSIGFLPGTPTAVAQGRCNATVYDIQTDEYLGGEGNLTFNLTVVDAGTNGKDEDTFKLEVRYADGTPYGPANMEAGQYLQGGNVVIHDPAQGK